MNKKEKVFTKEIAEKIMKEHDLYSYAVFSALNLPLPQLNFTTREQAKKEYISALQEGRRKRTAAFKKWIGLVRTSKQARKVYIETPDRSEEKAVALKKLEELLAKEIKAAETLEQAEKAYDSALRGSKEMTAAWEKWREFSVKEIEVAQTPEQIERAYYRAPEGSEERKVAVRKIASFYL